MSFFFGFSVFHLSEFYGHLVSHEIAWNCVTRPFKIFDIVVQFAKFYYFTKRPDVDATFGRQNDNIIT